MYLERISMLKKNFNTCEDGKYFLQKTEPLWNSLTQCFYKKSLIARQLAKSSDAIKLPEGYIQLLYEQAKNIDASSSYVRDVKLVDSVLMETLMAG